MTEPSELEQPDLSLIDQARAAGKSYIDSFKGDLDAMIADLNRRTEQAGRKVSETRERSESEQRLPTP